MSDSTLGLIIVAIILGIAVTYYSGDVSVGAALSAIVFLSGWIGDRVNRGDDKLFKGD